MCSKTKTGPRIKKRAQKKEKLLLKSSPTFLRQNTISWLSIKLCHFELKLFI